MKKELFLLTLVTTISCSTDLKQTGRSPSNYLSSFNNIRKQIERADSGKSSDLLNYATSFEKLEDIYKNRDFIEIYNSKSAAEIKAHNKLIFSLLKNDIETRGKRAGYLNQKEVVTIIDHVKNSRNEVNKRQYDPSGDEGYCYARAILGHVQAINAGVEPASIKKLWMVGDVIGYPFHVGTMIKAEKGWSIVDSSWFPNGATAEKWINQFAGQKRGKDNMVFIAPGDRFAQNSPIKYNPIDFFNTDGNDYDVSYDFYRGYFRDFFEDIEKQELRVFPSRAAVASEDRILNQVESLNLLYDAYPEAYSKTKWKELFMLAEERLESFTKSHAVDSTASDNLAALGKKLGM